jgi:phospholipase C
MADNDLALGRLVEGISNSKFWPETCIFVIEDDPQNGFDHVDGHRSLALVCSPYTRRGAVISDFFNQTSVLHTMERILGLAPMNQMDAASPLMTKCFQAEAVLTPYEAEEAGVPLDQLTAAVTPAMRPWFVASSQQDFEGFDRADEDTMNRILWHALRGADAEYPEHLAGAHGKGLGSLKLKHGK